MVQGSKSEEQSIVIERASDNDQKSVKSILVDVSGAVQKPGVYTLEEDSRVQDAIIAAGGMSLEANRESVGKSINLASKLIDGMKIYIPFVGEDSGKVGTLVEGASSSLISINSASSKELESLPGIGEVTAEKIISNRPYNSLEEVVSKGALRQSVYEKVRDSLSL